MEARLIEDTLNAKGIDHSRCRYAPGEGGFALVTLQDGDRLFLGSNKGGVARTHPLELTQEDLSYAKGFSLVYSNCNGFADRELPKLKAAGLPIAFDFSDRWTQDYLRATLPWVDIALLSLLPPACRAAGAGFGPGAAPGGQNRRGHRRAGGLLGQVGGKALSRPRRPGCPGGGHHGRGRCLLRRLSLLLLQTAGKEGLFARDLSRRIPQAMERAAAYAAKTCALEGAFGGGVPLAGRTELTPLEKDLSL